MLSKRDEIRARKVIEMAKANSDTLEHSAKGTTWKKHKYIKKIGNRYYYTDKKEDDDDELIDLDEIIETPDFESLPEKVDKIRPDWIKDFNNTVIWSPDKNKKSLVSDGKKAIDNMINKLKARVSA